MRKVHRKFAVFERPKDLQIISIRHPYDRKPYRYLKPREKRKASSLWREKALRMILRIILRTFQAGGQGLEPRLTGPEPVVLPLDDPPRTRRSLATRRRMGLRFSRPAERCRSVRKTPAIGVILRA